MHTMCLTHLILLNVVTYYLRVQIMGLPITLLYMEFQRNSFGC